MNKEEYVAQANKIKPFLSEYVNEITKPTKVKNQYICPLCNSGAGKHGTGAFTIYPETNSYYCYACGRGGDIFSLYSTVNGVDFKESAKRLSEKYNAGFNVSMPVTAPAPAKSEKNYTRLFQYAETQLQNTDYLTKRGIPPEIQRKFHCGYMPDFKHGDNQETPAVIIPTSDSSFTWRSTTENHKQKRGKACIFNPSALNNPYCFVVEGEIDCISVYSCGYNFPCIATGSVSNIKKIFDYSLENVVLIIAMDNDGAGQNAAAELEKLCITNGTPFIAAHDIWSDCKDCNELLIKNRDKLTENLKRYATLAKNFNHKEHKEQLKEKNNLLTPAQTSGNEWGTPLQFEKAEKLPPLPNNCFPDTIDMYLKAVCDFVQVPVEMGVLPLLSVLSLCVQGKALIKHPYNEHTQPLNLYTITAAVPGERKSGTLTAFLKPVSEYQQKYNEEHKNEIEEYKAELRLLENQLESATKGKNADLETAKHIAREITRLKANPINELILNVCDVTPEALASELFRQNEKMGLIDHEGGIFDILSGLYTGKTPNIDIFLKGYDGDQYTVLRRGAGNIILYRPLLAIGLMTQPEKLASAIENKQFMSRGLMHRFLFAFPEKTQALKISSPDIPKDIESLYNNVIKILLERPIENAIPVIQFEENTKDLFINYFEHIQQLKSKSESYPDFCEWLSKHFSRALRIAGILHLISNAPNKKVNALTVQQAINLATWCEAGAKKVFCDSAVESDENKNAKYVLEKIKTFNQAEISKRAIKEKCRKFSKVEELDTSLKALEEMGYIALETIRTVRKPKEIIKVNPKILK